MTNHYIFGYGSLINSESRSMTGDSGKITPVRVKGLKREWNVIISEYQVISLGTIHQDRVTSNGVIIPIAEDELPKFDERELKYDYNRVEIDNSKIFPLSSESISTGKIWAYIANNPTLPTKEYPIIQSYIDVVMTGCLYFGEEFASEFVHTTGKWENPWINDRQAPIYPRYMKSVSLAKQIDKMLSELVPQAFEQRRTV
ncbi:MAG: gamma-glutamylcyclotransferase [Aestuariibacter sp.]|nr:gamma-glutamylcyclotransferase [Aestuariibacter sp.]